ncbi:NimA-related protein kinase 8, partial [Volvox carteri f. nagariensis]
LDLIGKGTYGKVYKVRSRAEDEIYVVKKVHFDGVPQSEAEAALREGQVLSLLRHPHVVPYKEFFKHTDGDLCLVMAYCEGGDLFRYIRDLRKHGKTVPESQVWQWLVQLLLSLSYIHTKRILHRDVKTQNIFLSQGKVLLGDFGLAKQLQRTFEMARTPIGTPYYMAPEIFEEQPYSFKSDVWALGCVMYEMMTGKAAFAADNLSRVVLRVIRGQYDPLPESYSASLRAVVTSMLCRDVNSRPDANQLLTVPPVVPHVQV